MVTDSDTRGQLLLVGGLAIAIVFLLSIVLTNSLVVTTYTATPESADHIETVADRQSAIERDLRIMTTAVRNNTTMATFNSTYNSTLRNYTRYRTRVSGTQSGTHVNVTWEPSTSEGRYIKSTPSSPGSGFRVPGGGPSTWDLATNVDRISAFNFTATSTTGATPAPEFTVIVRGDSGDQWELSVDQVGTGEVIVDPPGSSPTTVCSSPSSGPDIEVDLLQGECTVGSTTASFPTFESSLDKPYTRVRIERGEKIRGTLLYASSGSFPRDTSGGYAVIPVVNVDYTGPGTSYERTVTLENST